MSSEQDLAGDRQVYRTSGSLLVWWGWLVLAVVILVMLALRGHDHSAAVTAVLVVAITGIVYGCALHPRIVADAAGITVLNPLRAHVVPWAAVTRVALVQTVQVHYKGSPGAPPEKVVHSWAVQSSPRATARGELRARRAARRAPEAGYGKLPGEARVALQGSAAEFIARQLDERARMERQHAGAGQQAAQVRWAWGAIAAMGLPLLALLIVAVT